MGEISFWDKVKAKLTYVFLPWVLIEKHREFATTYVQGVMTLSMHHGFYGDGFPDKWVLVAVANHRVAEVSEMLGYSEPITDDKLIDFGERKSARHLSVIKTEDTDGDPK